MGNAGEAEGRLTVMTHLFGVIFATEIGQLGAKPIADRIGKNIVPAINDACNLAEYVDVHQIEYAKWRP